MRVRSRKCDKRGKEYSCFTEAAKDKRFRTVFANWKRRLARALKAQRKITGRAKSVILNVTATFNCRRKIHSSFSERAWDLRRKKKKKKKKKQTGRERGRGRERQTLKAPPLETCTNAARRAFSIKVRLISAVSKLYCLALSLPCIIVVQRLTNATMDRTPGLTKGPCGNINALAKPDDQ